MRDVTEDGKQAYLDGDGKDACPYREDYAGGDYWNSTADKRQRWLVGYSRASLCNEILARWRCMPAAEWREWS